MIFKNVQNTELYKDLENHLQSHNLEAMTVNH